MNARKAITLVAAVVLVASGVKAGPDDPVYFADDNLKQAVKDALGITTDPTEAQMATLTELEADNKGISDLTGMEYATNLQNLHLRDNQIANIGPIAGLANLWSLRLNGNQISDIPDLSTLSKLRTLNLGDNQISDLTGLSGLIYLKNTLGLDDNQIVDISPLANLKTLESLRVNRNQISVIPDLSGMTSLTVFEAQENQITDFSALSGVAGLETIKLDGNQISTIPDLSGLPNLKSLYLPNNQVSEVSALTGFPNLERLFLNGNQVNDISSLAGLSTLQVLHLGGNQVSNISPLSGLTNLTTLKLQMNQINEISALSGMTKMEELLLEANQISDISSLSGMTNLRSLGLSWNEISNISALSGKANLTWLQLRSNQISDINPLSGLIDLVHLVLDRNKITDISPLSGLSNLERLELQKNPLDWAAYCEYIPMILTHNPGIDLRYDENPYPYGCDYEPAPTPTGPSIVVIPEDYTTGTTPVTLTFEEVTESGYTSLATSHSGPAPPTGFQLGDPPTYYDITTTASYSDLISVCISYSGITFTGPPEALRLGHYEDPYWVDCTDFVDTENQLICGLVSSLSTFAIGEDVAPPTITSVSAYPDTLWPPNHEMVEVTVDVEATDNGPTEPSSYILGITVNDPGDGNTDSDWLLFPDEPLVVLLRAERAGGGNGRVYTIDVECVDASGNTATGTVDVVVPHDQGSGKNK